jgi:hypothetical protein
VQRRGGPRDEVGQARDPLVVGEQVADQGRQPLDAGLQFLCPRVV